MSTDPFDTLRTFITESGASGKYFSLRALEKMAPGRISPARFHPYRAPEACFGTAQRRVTEEHVQPA
jgi:hypothetical protein